LILQCQQDKEGEQDKRIEILIFLFWAHPCTAGTRTGLSACIFFACGKKGYRFNPLREPKPLRGLVIAGAALDKPRANAKK
jgi:hypothetical protein